MTAYLFLHIVIYRQTVSQFTVWRLCLLRVLPEESTNLLHCLLLHLGIGVSKGSRVKPAEQGPVYRTGFATEFRAYLYCLKAVFDCCFGRKSA